MTYETYSTFQCDSCNRSFGVKYTLRMHEKAAHEYLKPLQCEVCDKSFDQKLILESHLKNVMKK